MAKSSFFSGTGTNSTDVESITSSKAAAEAAAANAADSETAAAASETAAATSATNASVSASSAATSASNAATSATSASTSETNASTSATSASTSATAAAASATAAAASETAAAASETAAAASETAAGTSATSAATSATSAATSATNAATSATAAAASETSVATNATAAATSATNAATSETNAATSETNAATSETNAATSASSASTSATSASTSASSAASAQTAAESARDATLTAYDNFDDRYLGAKTSDPSLDNDGNALVAGALYFDSTAGAMKVYTGSAWVAAYVSGTSYLPLVGGTLTGTLNFGDNVKAQFGASADLQVYHDGSNSVIEDVGSGVLYMRSNGDGIGMYDSENDVMLFARKDAEVGLYHNGNLKLLTTSSGAYVYDQIEVKADTGYGRIEVGGSDGGYLDLKSPFSDDYDGRIITFGSGLDIISGTGTPIRLQHGGSTKLQTSSGGIDVTGTVVADGITSSQDITISESIPQLVLVDTDGTDVKGTIVQANTNLVLRSRGGTSSYGGVQLLRNNGSDVKALEVQPDGDIAFYEDTGTTAKLTWSASAEQLQLDAGVALELNGWTITESGGSLYFATGGTNKMKLDASGNLQVVGSVDANATIT